MKRELKNGLYSHFKEGELYAVYDRTKPEVNISQTDISYIRLSDGEKFNRVSTSWFDDVSQREDNNTGQKTRYKLLDTEITFYTEAVFEADPSLKQFLEANNIPFDISLGDKVLGYPANTPEGEESELKSWVISGIVDKGVYTTLPNGSHILIFWKYVKGFVKNFK